MVNFNLLKVLREIQEKVNKIAPRLNMGGCGVFAAAVATELETLGIPVGVRVFSPDGKDSKVKEVKGNLNTVWDWYANVGGFIHCAVEFEWKGRKILFDSWTLSVNPKKFCSGHFPLLEEPLTVKDISQMAENTGWNECFDRDLIPDIKFAVGKAFYLAKKESNN